MGNQATRKMLTAGAAMLRYRLDKLGMSFEWSQRAILMASLTNHEQGRCSVAILSNHEQDRFSPAIPSVSAFDGIESAL